MAKNNSEWPAALLMLSAVAKSGFSPSPSFFKLHNKICLALLYRFVVVAGQQRSFNTDIGQNNKSLGVWIIWKIFWLIKQQLLAQWFQTNPL
jgi:hypothetical protein